MWEQIKQAMVESARKMCGSMKVGGKNPKSIWWNDYLKAAVQRRVSTWKVLAASNEEAKESCMEAYREEKRKVKRCIYESRKKLNEQFGRKMNGNKNLF